MKNRTTHYLLIGILTATVTLAFDRIENPSVEDLEKQAFMDIVSETFNSTMK